MPNELSQCKSNLLLQTPPLQVSRICLAEEDSDLRLWSRQDELRTARDIQQQLLPLRCPVIPGFTIAARSTPALEVGGDHYNFFWVGGDRLGIFIADVSGKGMPAALVATMLRATVHTLSYGNGDVRDVLTRANDWMGKSLRRGMFVTCTYGILHLRTRRLTWARAGHEPLLLARSNEKIELLSPVGFPLGVVGSREFRNHLEVSDLALSSGDRLLLWTDGLTEAMNACGEEFGLRRVLMAINSSEPSTCMGGDRGSDLDRVENALAGHIAEEPLSDDLTLVSLVVE